MALLACQSDNTSPCFTDPVPCGTPYFFRSLTSTTTDVESSKCSVVASFRSTADRLSTTSLDLEITEYKLPKTDESTESSSKKPYSHSSDAIQPVHIPILYAGMVDGDQSPLKTLALTNTIEPTETTDIFESFEESTVVLPNRLLRPGAFDISHRKDGDVPPFRKWIKSFRRKELKRRAIIYPSIEVINALGSEDTTSAVFSSKAGTKTPSSSMRFVTAVKTASNTFTSLSITAGSTRRKSSGGTLDDATVMRMRDRRCALEELINTEEYYIADLKVLMNVSPCLHVSSYFLLLLITIWRDDLTC